jgi:hypothetical protein
MIKGDTSYRRTLTRSYKRVSKGENDREKKEQQPKTKGRFSAYRSGRRRRGKEITTAKDKWKILCVPLRKKTGKRKNNSERKQEILCVLLTKDQSDSPQAE